MAGNRGAPHRSDAVGDVARTHFLVFCQVLKNGSAGGVGKGVEGLLRWCCHLTSPIVDMHPSVWAGAPVADALVGGSRTGHDAVLPVVRSTRGWGHRNGFAMRLVVVLVDRCRHGLTCAVVEGEGVGKRPAAPQHGLQGVHPMFVVAPRLLT